MSVNQMGARLIFKNASAALKRAGLNIAKAKLTQSFLRLEQAVVAAKTLYTFPILVNETQLGIFNTENRLNLQDSFVVSQLGFFISVPSGATDATFALQSYPNAIKFPTGAAGMQTLYNSKISLTVNNDVLLPSWDTLRNLYVPVTQDGIAATGGVNTNIDAFDGSENGFYPVEPNITLIGSKNSSLQLELPAAIATIDANSRITIMLRGVLAQNSTVVS